MTTPHRPLVTVIGLAIALGAIPAFVVATDAFSVDVPPVGRIAVQWLLAGVVLAIAVGPEDLSFPDVGFRRPAPIDIGYVLLTSVAVIAVFSATDPLIRQLGLPVQSDAGAMGADVGLGIALATAVTTGVVEEVLYRGYPIERLLAVTDSPLLAGGVTWGLFTVAHAVSWPLGNLVQVALVALVFTLVYLRRRTLAPVIGAHVLVWVLAALGQSAG